MRIRIKIYVFIIFTILIFYGCSKDYGSTNGPIIGPSTSVFPALIMPENFGVNYHLYNAQQEDPDLISDAGLKYVRIDLPWFDIEQQKGIYNFTGYDYVFDKFKEKDIGLIVILNDSNPLYEDNIGIITETGRNAFANFCYQAVTRYKDYDIIWEIWNEPDVHYFWLPQPAVEDYMLLVKKAIPAIRDAAPDAICIAPAAGDLTPPFDFLKDCFDRGLLDYVDGISVHPYRDKVPETAIDDISQLRALILQYKPNKNIPILAGEWGFSPYIGDTTIHEDLQAASIVRMMLVTFMSKIPITIWYDWRNDGDNPQDPGNNYGLLEANSLVKKPVYFAFKNMVTNLNGMIFKERISTLSSEDFIFLFESLDENKSVLVAWTTDKTFSFTEHEVELPSGTKVNINYNPQYFDVSK